MKTTIAPTSERGFDVCVNHRGVNWVLAYLAGSGQRNEDRPDAVVADFGRGGVRFDWYDVPKDVLKASDKAASDYCRAGTAR